MADDDGAQLEGLYATLLETLEGARRDQLLKHMEPSISIKFCSS